MSLKYKNLPLKSCAYKSFENMYGFICKSILFVALRFEAVFQNCFKAAVSHCSSRILYNKIVLICKLKCRHVILIRFRVLCLPSRIFAICNLKKKTNKLITL